MTNSYTLETRKVIESAIEALIALLDHCDGDADMEPEPGDHEPELGDYEYDWLGTKEPIFPENQADCTYEPISNQPRASVPACLCNDSSNVHGQFGII